ncbi:hypothetical protein THER5_1915 [Bifidobacterium thermacidophilum subsp. thermacidophilum]|uniref:Uncharacterized protein n=1 Tax=Bifidobacterium thermacidophilum subsp. thermacidophilum TaxID=79262 RepID=A0A087E2T5_9BIFI|nr:hypothetical protein THER5_1915 [Bifidobacterium thermacidophilum subsp. thermacidophilum]
MRCSSHTSPIPQTGHACRPRANPLASLYIVSPPRNPRAFPAPSLRNPHFANPHFANPRALAPQSLRPFLRSLRNPHLLSFANRRIAVPISPLSHKLATLSGR